MLSRCQIHRKVKMPLKQGPQGPQKLSSLKSLKIQIPPPAILQPSKMTFLSNSRWQNRKERPHRSKNNGDMVEKAKCVVVIE